MQTTPLIPLCSTHNQPLKFICFSQRTARESSCSNRLLCEDCPHTKTHSKCTFIINDLISQDFSLSFFQLFFSLPQIKTLYVPLQINTFEIKTILDSLLLPFKHNSTKTQAEISLEEEVLKIESTCKRINDLINRIHIQFNEKYDWSAVESLIKLLSNGTIGSEQANELLSETIEWISGASKFVKNIYIIEVSAVKEALEKNKQTHQIGKLFKELKRELFANMNYIRALFITSQPQYMLAVSQNIRPPFITTFPIKANRFIQTISMISPKDIKLSRHNQLLVIKKNECQIIQISSIPSLNKLKSIIYTENELVDAAISNSDSMQLALLFREGVIQFYIMKPQISVFENELIFEMQFNATTDTFSCLNFATPQLPNKQKLDDHQSGEDDNDDIQIPSSIFDHVVLQSENSISLVETGDGSIVEEFPISNSLQMCTIDASLKNAMDEEVSSEQERVEVEETDEQKMKKKNSKQIICFHRDKQVDSIHLINSDLLSNQTITNMAFSNLLKHFAYAANHGIHVVMSHNKQKGSIKREEENTNLVVKFPSSQEENKSIVCMGFTSDHNYLFILWNTSYICFFHTIDQYKLEFETYLFKSGEILQAVFAKISNAIILLHSDETIHQVNLSSSLNFC